MKKGAIIVSSVELAERILSSNKKTKYEISHFFRKNKFAGSKDKIKIRELVFKFLKNYFTLKYILKKNFIKFSNRNALLLYYLYNNKIQSLEDLYDGKFSINPEVEDKKIYKLALSFVEKIIPSLPNWLEKKLSKEFKKNLYNNYKSILKEPRFDIRVNSFFTDRASVLQLLDKHSISCNKTFFSPLGITMEKRIIEKKIKSINKNFFEVQDEGSQIVTFLSGAKSGMRILDYCAGKGTKTLALQDIMRKKGEIYVHDTSLKRLDFLKKRLNSMNINNEITFFENKDKFQEYFDLIVLDVPCTGSGIWRRRPEAIIKLKKYELKKYIKIQAELLNKVVKYCKKGGLISYITCSLFEDENESQIKKFLLNNKAFKIIDINLILKNNYSEINIKSICKWLTITPSLFNSDAFFICLLKRYV